MMRTFIFANFPDERLLPLTLSATGTPSGPVG